jgi:hypothetical protein
MVRCNENLFVQINSPEEDPDYTSGTVDEGAYVEYLDAKYRGISAALANTMPSIRSAALRLRDDLATEDFEAFIRIWAVESGTLWRVLMASHLLGEFDLPSDPSSNQEEENSYYPILQDKAEDFFIPLAGPWSAAFSWSFLPEYLHPNAQAFAQKVAQAFSRKNEHDLYAIINFLLSIPDAYSADLKSLLEEVRREQQKYHRVVVKGQISNTGGSAFSVLPRAKLFIDAKDYPYTVGTDEEAIDSQQTYPQNMEIDGVLLSETPEQAETRGVLDSPISIEAGGIQRFRAVSVAHVDDLEGSEVLRKMYSAGERTFRLALVSVTAGGEPTTPLYSAPQLFRNWKTQIKLAPPESTGGRLVQLFRRNK